MTSLHQPARSVTRHDHLEPQVRGAGEPVLVVVFLRGGADGLTLVPPVGDDGYHRARPLLAVAKRDTLPLNDYFALNAELAPLARHFEAGDLAIVHGAGSEDDSRSHFEAQDTMEHGGRDVGSGWLGRLLRARPQPAGSLAAVAIGTTRPESLRGAPSGAVIQSVQEFRLGPDDEEAKMIEALTRLYAREQTPLGGAGRSTLEAVRRLRVLRSQPDAPGNGAVYPATDFGRGLREIARLIKADVGLVATTIDLGGWDTHFVQQTMIGGLMRDLAGGIDAFQTDLGEHGQRVTTIVMTEFGRRLRENSSFGTDHGAGSVMLAVGDGPRRAGTGGTIVSGWPDLSERHLDDVGDVPAAIDFRAALRPYLELHSPGVDLDRVFKMEAGEAAADRPRRPSDRLDGS